MSLHYQENITELTETSPKRFHAWQRIFAVFNRYFTTELVLFHKSVYEPHFGSEDTLCFQLIGKLTVNFQQETSEFCLLVIMREAIPAGWPLSRHCEIPWHSLMIRGTPAHVKWYSYHASTSVIVNDWNMTLWLHNDKSIKTSAIHRVLTGCY